MEEKDGDFGEHFDSLVDAGLSDEEVGEELCGEYGADAIELLVALARIRSSTFP